MTTIIIFVVSVTMKKNLKNINNLTCQIIGNSFKKIKSSFSSYSFTNF